MVNINFGLFEQILEKTLVNRIRESIPKDYDFTLEAHEAALKNKYICLYTKGIEINTNLDYGVKHIRFFLNTKGYQDGYSYYSENLPFEIFNTMRKKEIHKTLGKPTETFERFENKLLTFPEREKYTKNSYHILIEYNPDESLYSVAVGLN